MKSSPQHDDLFLRNPLIPPTVIVPRSCQTDYLLHCARYHQLHNKTDCTNDLQMPISTNILLFGSEDLRCLFSGVNVLWSKHNYMLK